MKLTIINQTQQRIPRQYLTRLLRRLSRRLCSEGILQAVPAPIVVVVFLGPRRAQALNREFRGKDYATDVLSFAGDGRETFGELVFCPAVVKRQAHQQQMSFRDELGYLFIHGFLHLLGFTHEHGGKAARRMYELQDALFEDLCLAGETAKKR